MTYEYYIRHMCHLGHRVIQLPNDELYLSSLPGAGYLIAKCFENLQWRLH